MKSSTDVRAWTPTDVISPSGSGTQETYGASELERILWIFGQGGKSSSENTSRTTSAQRKIISEDISSWTPGDLTSIGMNEPEPGTPVAGPQLDNFDAAVMSSPSAKASQRQNASTSNENQEKVVEDAYLQAEFIVASRIADAQKEIDEMMQKAMLQRDEIIQKAYDEGYAKGISEITSAVQASKAMLENFSFWRQEMLSNSETDVIGLVKEIATSLFGEGYEMDAVSLQNAFSRVLINARSLGDLRLYVNPEDAKFLDPAWREYQVLVNGQRIQILPTEAIRRGGCYVEGQRGSVDARIENQLRALLDNGLSEDDDSSPREKEGDE